MPLTSLAAPADAYSSASGSGKGHYFLQGLQHITFGSMRIVTPENAERLFRGPVDGPVAELHLKDWRVLDDLVARGEIGFAEAYIDGRWDSPDIAALVTFALVNTQALERFFHGKPLYALWLKLKDTLSRNSIRGSKRNIMAHYDLGNDFYALWLDASMTYSSALFEGDASKTLEAAQQAKYQRILGKIDAKPGDHVLEIGCGWGGFAVAAAKAGLRVTAVTISQRQAEYARARFAQEGLENAVTLQLEDYRNVQGTYDRIVSIGMFEHVGKKYWPVYFNTLKRLLKPGGIAVVQSITLDDGLFEKLGNTTGFIEHYIFPGGMLPSKHRFGLAVKKAGLECREMFAFGGDYALTLREWLKRFETHLPQVRQLGYDEPFIRLWRFYLASCIASFESRRTEVMQAELRA